MPEGDSLRRAAARLQVLVGRRVEAASPHPRGAATGVAERVDGRVLESAEAVGKHLLLRFEGDVTVRSHLRMQGRWHVSRAGSRLTGRPWLVLRAGDWEARQWNGPVLTLDVGPAARLGPDVLDEAFDPAAAARRLRAGGRGRPLGEVVQDQRLVAGVGNMWMAEALWEARLSPWLAVDEAADDELKTALAAASRLMHEALAGGRRPRQAYRRAPRPCRRCGTPIRARGQGDANRTAYWCPGCQRGPDVPS